MVQEKEKPLLRISVRSLVEFILRFGDIDNRKRQGGSADAMQEGGRLHRKLQKGKKGDYQSEVALSWETETEWYRLITEGRADGIFTMKESDRNLQRMKLGEEFFEETWNRKGKIRCIDEIKTTYHRLEYMKGPGALHLAQAKCYAAIYVQKEKLSEIGIQMTYVHRKTEQIRYFYEEYSAEEIVAWYQELLRKYEPFAKFLALWPDTCRRSLKALEFPFSYRKGQRDVAVSVYRTIQREKNLFLQAPTGVGKTISTVFPALKAMGEGLVETIFYVTAKTITAKAAVDAVRRLESNGGRIKRILLTAKEKLCPWEEMECNPEQCERAKGHFDRVNQAIYELLIRQDEFDRDTVIQHAADFCVCPFEFQLDLSEFCDMILGDYNYLFDPRVRLKRYFSEEKRGEYVFLVDEAHNLVDRAREMYSAKLYKEDVLHIRNLCSKDREEWNELRKALSSVNRELLILKREPGVYSELDKLYRRVERLGEELWEFLDNYSETEHRKELLEFYFQVHSFLTIFELSSEGYVYYGEMTERDFCVNLLCVDTGTNLSRCLAQGRTAVFFSATLLPVNYYRKLLGSAKEDYAVYIPSPFSQENRRLLIATDVTSRYSRRGETEYQKIADYLAMMMKARVGNYMVFFPSFQFLHQVVERIPKESCAGYEQIFQETSMTEGEREAFLERFQEEGQRGMIAFCVMGGIFSEGIDLTGNRLIGVAVVGTGIGQMGQEHDLIRNYFDQRKMSGFDYAYRIPGMNRVCQAAGRVIRTEEDEGVILLLDERFLEGANRRLFPSEWSDAVYGGKERILTKMEEFWKEREKGTKETLKNKCEA